MAGNSYSLASLIVGVIAIIMSLLILDRFVFIFGLGAALLGFYALDLIKKQGTENKTLAIIGIVLGFISAILLVGQMMLIANDLSNSSQGPSCEEMIGECVSESVDCGGVDSNSVPAPYECEEGKKCCFFI